MATTEKNIGAGDLLKSILDSSFDGIMAFRAVRDNHQEIVDFEWLFVNDVAEAIVGMTSESLIGQRLLEVMPGNKEAGLFDRYKEVVETGKFTSFEQFYPGENVNKWFRISAVKLADGFTVTFQDITELKISEIEAIAQEKKYQRLFEKSIDPIFTINEEGDILDANSAFHELFEFTTEDLEKLQIQQIFKSEDDFSHYHHLLVNDKKIEELELALVTKSGKVKLCLINSISIPDVEEEGAVYLGVVRDITRRRQVAKELFLAEKLSMTGKIARTIAHEVRNPLTNLTLALEQLQDEIPDSVEDAEMYISIIRRNADRIGKLIADLLNSSKPRELKLVNRSLNESVSSAIHLVKDRLNLKNMSLKESYDHQLPDLPLDKEQLQVAILNLLVNAIEAMEENKGVLEVKTYQEDQKCYLSIKDNGKGIPEEKLDSLFEPFFSVKKEGTGLGLTAVQNIIHSHKGKIEVNSEQGKGTEFLIRFEIV